MTATVIDHSKLRADLIRYPNFVGFMDADALKAMIGRVDQLDDLGDLIAQLDEGSYSLLADIAEDLLGDCEIGHPDYYEDMPWPLVELMQIFHPDADPDILTGFEKSWPTEAE